MEENKLAYQLEQDNIIYIFSTSIVGNLLRMSCQNSQKGPSKISYRDFSIQQLKEIDPIFNFISTPQQASKYIDDALRKQKVGILDENNKIKVMFYITTKGVTHTIEIPLYQNNIEGQTLNTESDYFAQIKTLDTNTNQLYDSIPGKDNLDNLDLNKFITTTNNTIDINEYNKSDYNQLMGSEKKNSIQHNQYSEYYHDLNNSNNIYQQNNKFDNPPYIGPVNDSVNQESNNNIYLNQGNVHINEAIVESEITKETKEISNPMKPITTTKVLPVQTTTRVLPPIPFSSLNGLDLNNLANINIPTQIQNENYYQTMNSNYEPYITQKTNIVTTTTTGIKQTEMINNYDINNEIIIKDEQISKLKEENLALNKQLLELKNNSNESEEINALKLKLKDFEQMKKKMGEIEILKTQLTELNTLREKLAQFNTLKAQLSEMNKMKAKISEFNTQLKEFNELKLKAAELEKLQKKNQELEKINMSLQEEIKTLKDNKILYSTLKTNSSKKDIQGIYDEETQAQITVKGDIIHSPSELELITRKINKSNKKLVMNLLYKASADSDKAAAFHAKCDEAQSSLVLVETDKGKRFGGFTTCSWAGDCVDKKDEKAFIFSLDKMMTYDNIHEEEAIGCYPKYGPIFLGCQIRIYDNAFSNGGTTFEKGLNFETEEDYELTGGERFFKVKDIEVYEVLEQ